MKMTSNTVTVNIPNWGFFCLFVCLLVVVVGFFVVVVVFNVTLIIKSKSWKT